MDKHQIERLLYAAMAWGSALAFFVIMAVSINSCSETEHKVRAECIKSGGSVEWKGDYASNCTRPVAKPQEQ